MAAPALNKRACPVCRSKSPMRIYAGANYDPSKLNAFSFASRKDPELMHYRLLLCGNCDAVYASPAPKPGSLKGAYEEAAFDSGEEAGFAARSYFNHIPSGLPSRLGALDIGTGDGAFLEKLLEGGFTKVKGVEPSLAPIRAAKPATRRLIRHGVFTGREARPSSLSLVTCFQTLEHVDEPLKVLAAARKILRRGGAFYAVCHSHRALSTRLLGRRSPIFDIEHLQLFSPVSLRRLLEEAGFVRVEVRPISNVYPLHYWLKVFPLPKALKGILRKAALATGLGRLPLPMPAGNLAVTGYKP